MPQNYFKIKLKLTHCTKVKINLINQEIDSFNLKQQDH